jgi:hypothetical protein
VSKRLHIMSLAFNSTAMCLDAIKLFEKQHEGVKFASKTLVDPHYPLALQPMHTKALFDIALQYGWNFIRPFKNLGVAGGWNLVINELGLTEGDVLIGIDPDGRPQQDRWANAILDVFNNDPSCYYITLNRESIYSMKHLGHKDKKVGDHWVVEFPQLVSWCLGGFDIGWVKKVGEVGQYSKLYSYTEHHFYDRATPMGGKFYYIRDFYDDHLKADDQEYTAWKLASANHTTELDFKDWLHRK